jgi:hypothetical protein
MEESLLEVDLIPAKGNQFSDAKAMAVGEQDARAVPMPVTAGVASSLH